MAAGSGAGPETTVSSGHFGNDEYIESYGNTYDQYTQTDTIVATVGLAQVSLISLWQSLSAAALLLESLLLTCTSTINLPLLLAIGVKMPHVARLLFGKQRVWQCKTYDRSCVSLLSNRQNFLPLNASSPRQARDRSVVARADHWTTTAYSTIEHRVNLPLCIECCHDRYLSSLLERILCRAGKH